MAQLIVSISGIRGIVGDGLGPQEAKRFALAFGTHLGGGTVVLARDSRPHGPMLAEAFCSGLVAAGCRVLDAAILSTPGTAVMVQHIGASGGAVITASHNPAPYNGIKLLSAVGQGLSRREGLAVADLYHRQTFRQAPGGRVESLADAGRIHTERVLTVTDADTIRNACFRVVVDAVNGAGGAEMRLLLERLGCTCSMIHGEPTGDFGRAPEPVPENLGDLCQAVRHQRAAIGLALDPDADRLSLVDETGRAIGEEYTLALACRHRLTQQQGPLAANLSTSRMMDDVALEAGVALHRTPVGEVNVSEAIQKHGCLIGGEGNGGVIDPRVVLVRDSLAGAALILGMMATSGKSLGQFPGELPVYTLVKEQVPLGQARPDRVLRAVREHFTDAKVDDRDGVHLAWAKGWLHVRPSNTEPILRIIAEASEERTARGLVRQVADLVRGQS
ncbi:MAG: phosphoglucosamine mutase [Phycisphaerae bacterium]|nr:phosphoglucosamine mutase [Phycisphaerae bacterium]